MSNPNSPRQSVINLIDFYDSKVFSPGKKRTALNQSLASPRKRHSIVDNEFFVRDQKNQMLKGGKSPQRKKGRKKKIGGRASHRPKQSVSDMNGRDHLEGVLEDEGVRFVFMGFGVCFKTFKRVGSECELVAIKRA